MAEDPAILAALISSPYYRDTYLSPDSHEHDSRTVHGPYRAADISPEDFECSTTAAAEALVREFINLYQPLPKSEVLREIESVILPGLSVATFYRLRYLPDAEHEFAFVLLEFRELVAVSRAISEVVLIVMAID